jgi:hypothetical protein
MNEASSVAQRIDYEQQGDDADGADQLDQAGGLGRCA